jgi:hypothetical protein
MNNFFFKSKNFIFHYIKETFLKTFSSKKQAYVSMNDREKMIEKFEFQQKKLENQLKKGTIHPDLFRERWNMVAGHIKFYRLGYY